MNKHFAQTLLYAFLLATSICQWSCNQPKIIGKDDLVNILGEMFVADAYLQHNSGDYNIYSRRDSLSVYGPIVHKYGYELDDFNRSILYYARELNGLDLIFERVKTQLEEQSIAYEPLAKEERLAQNFWKGSDSVLLRQENLLTNLDFDIEIRDTGRYRIAAQYRFFADDSTRNSRLQCWLVSDLHPDSLYHKIDTLLTRDTLAHDYQLVIHINDTQYKRLKGFWLKSDSLAIPPIKPTTFTLQSLKQKADTQAQKKKKKKEKILIQHVIVKQQEIRYIPLSN